MRVLIERGADVNHAGGDNQRSILHVAAYNDTDGAIGVLVEAGAHVEARDRNGATPLYRAVQCCRFRALEALLDYGGDINARDYLNQSTPLHFAAAIGGCESAGMVDFLLQSGADETIVDNDGNEAADVIGQLSGCGEECSQCDHELVRDLLEDARWDRADRARRLRVYLVLCRAHPDRLRQVHESGSRHACAARGSRIDTMLPGAEGGRDDGAVGDRRVKQRTGVDWDDVVARVVGLQEEGIFRTIVGYL